MLPSTRPPSVAQRLERALEVLVPALDIIEARVDEGAPPAWCEARGWTGFLLSLADGDLARCEAEGLAACIDGLDGAPPSLKALARAADEAARLPRRPVQPLAPASLDELKAVPARKRLQLEALLGAVAPMAARARRLVDVGAGHGHFTRLAAARFDRDAVGLEREPDRVATASALAAGGRARFVAFDACEEALAFAPDDLSVGLHACGELGDRMGGGGGGGALRPRARLVLPAEDRRAGPRPALGRGQGRGARPAARGAGPHQPDGAPRRGRGQPGRGARRARAAARAALAA
ncbi:methyltransferase, partial [Sorangium sp. So ce136]